MPYSKHIPAEPRAASEPIRFEAEPFHYALPDRLLLADLIKVARRLKATTLFQQQYNKHGRFVAATIRTRFGSWDAALAAAHLQPCTPRLVSDQAILQDLREVQEKLGVPQLHREAYFHAGKFSTTNISRRFGSWSGALLAAGLPAVPQPHRNPSVKNLFDNFEQVWRTLGRQPRGRDFEPPLSRYSIGTYRKRFGGFRQALAHFIAHQKQLGKTTAPHEPIEIPHRHKTRRQVRANLRYQVLRRDNFKCRFCGRSPATDPSVVLHVDHKIPWSRGGETVLENLQSLCETCNVGKSNQ